MSTVEEISIKKQDHLGDLRTTFVDFSDDELRLMADFV